MKKGKLILLDGTDGSGKKTQCDLLVERLKRDGRTIGYVDFPRYGERSAVLVEDYLNGKFGMANEVDPYAASLFYALDRWVAIPGINQDLAAGKIVIANRYVVSSMGHQAGKIKSQVKRREYYQWLDNLEYQILKIPRPNLNIILHMPAAIAQRLIDHKSPRQYLNGKKRDIHEADLNHLQQAEQSYLEVATIFPNFKVIECAPDNQLMTPQEIHHLVWQAVEPLLEAK